MPDVLVDTDVASFFLKHDSRAARYEGHLKGNRLFLCFISVGELYRWAFVRDWGPAKWKALREHIKGYGVLPYDEAVTLAWARISNDAQKLGRRMEVGDAWIAATAVRHQLPLITHNASHYRVIESLQIISESSK